MPKKTAQKKDFFVSYTGRDKQIAEWIAWTLEEEGGYSTIIQAWDFKTGAYFTLDMDKAETEAERTIAVLSQAYVESRFCKSEWAAAYVQDPDGEKGKLIPVKVEDFEPAGNFKALSHINLTGLEEDAAQRLLLNEVKCRLDEIARKKPEKKPTFSRIAKRTVKKKPDFTMIPLTFKPLDLGRTDELVGRDEAMRWLEAHLFSGNGNATALVSSLQGAGGMGKTFLARTFAERYGDRVLFLPVYLGETKPFDAGMQFLRLEGFDTSMVDSDGKLKTMLHSFYAEGEGVLLLDDVRSADAELLFPQVNTWRVLLTTRDTSLANRLCGDGNVKALDVLSEAESLQLMKNVLGKQFMGERINDYRTLGEFLANRPYAIRLAAGYLAGALDPCPKQLLERLKNSVDTAVDDKYSFKRLEVLLGDCIGQLEAKSRLSMGLVSDLSVCADEGINAKRFFEWQERKRSDVAVAVIETGITTARDLGILLVEDDERSEEEGGGGRPRRTGLAAKRFRLHTDLLKVVRKRGEGDGAADDARRRRAGSLIGYYEAVLVKREYGKTLDRSLHAQVFSLVERFGGDGERCRRLYDAFWDHLRRTGELQQAFDLGETFRKQAEEKENKDDMQGSYGNQALILQARGRLDEAMELLQKMETICLEVGLLPHLKWCYNAQIKLLEQSGKTEDAGRVACVT